MERVVGECPPTRYGHFVFVLLGLTVCAGISSAAPVGGEKDAEGGRLYKVLRIIPETEDQLLTMANLYQNGSMFDLDFWHGPTRLYGAIDVMVGPEHWDAFRAYLTEHHLSHIVTVPDVQKLIDSKQPRRTLYDKSKASSGGAGNFSRRYQDASGRVGTFSISQYHSYVEIQQYLADIQARFPSRAQVFNIGTTHEGRAITVLKVGTPVADDGISNTKRAFWIDGGIHAREWIAPTTALYFIQQLVTNYDTDPVIRQYVDNIDWYILPVANPDGYEYSRSSTFPRVRLWRKNRSPAICRSGSTTNCCQGVDLNRNFDFAWGQIGSSHDPCDEVYAGAAPFSEPETRAIRDFLDQRAGRFDGFVTLHSYSQIWMFPFGHKVRTYPADVEDLKSVAVIAKRALQANFGTKYVVGTGADTLYPAAGGSDDWAKDKQQVKYVYLIELRPEEHILTGFILDEDQIIPTGKETWDGVKIVADAILQWNGIKPLNRGPPSGTKAPGSATCVDHEARCHWWASFGGCRTWAELQWQCPKSCRVCDPDKPKSPYPLYNYSPACTDQIDNCESWSKLNLCNWVMDLCRRTCDLCRV